jgi:predicted component of type VI protein secretion system
MKVSDPIDHVELSYGIEALITEARENDVDEHEMKRELRAILKSVEEGKL